ncbi:SGNH/GDSL hydrolase family protein [Staphylococcus massiliensis]|uniref:SGNH/GDSL hydrolase family protein n=1 Tax=Staphylococcus massiliensis TaxID=555791 RepID=UPI001EDE5954|nr:SGNH/GDSL hydrolase family protein [Staphylococcus massiliensis]
MTVSKRIGQNVKLVKQAVVLLKNTNRIRKGNRYKFRPNTKFRRETALSNKEIAFLGSSVTYGAVSRGQSFVEYLREEYGVNTHKSAKSGTTLSGNVASRYGKSYVMRLRDDFKDVKHLDAFVCQLSTNDGRFDRHLGEIIESKHIQDFDVETTIGAIEYIIAYIYNRWDCKLVFCTCLRQSDPYYEYLIETLYRLSDKWGFDIIDIKHHKRANKMAKKDKTMMADDAHPTFKGYRYIYTPIFVKYLLKYFDQ